MTLILDEQFTGANGDPWNAARWTTRVRDPGATWTIQSNQGRALTSAVGNYGDQMQAQTVATMTGGEVYYQFVVASKVEYQVYMFACASGGIETWTNLNQYGYNVHYIPASGALRLLRMNNYTQVALATATVACVVGDVIHVAIRPGVGAYVWKNSATRPTTPTMASTDTAYASGRAGVGILGGGATTAIPVPFESIVMDDLVAVEPEPEPPASPFYTLTAGGTRVPLNIRTLAAGGTGEGAGTPVWAEEFDTLDLATTQQSTATWRPNDVWQSIGRGYRDFAGTSWNINPNETLGGAKRTPFSVANSILTISAIRTPAAWVTDINASLSAQGQGGTAPAWSGGMLISNPQVKKFKYGYFAIKARWPNAGRGMFPALWLFATDGSSDPLGKGAAEIDLFEIFGHATGRPWNITVHYRDGSNNILRPSVDLATIDTDTADWHVWGVDWQPNWLRFYKDGVQVAELTGEDATWMDTDMGIRINYAMDAGWFPTKSDGSTPSPLLMEIDWVRVWNTKS